MLKSRGIVLPAGLLVLVGLWFAGCAKRESDASPDFVIFDRTRVCAIMVPAGATEQEVRAAHLLQQTLAKAARRPRHDFPLVREVPEGRPVIVVQGTSETDGPKLEERVAYRATPGRVEISAYPAEAIEGAAAWFLEKTVGARWFMPGPLGEHVPQREELRLPAGETSHRPSYISRNLSVPGGGGGTEWFHRNRLRSRFSHGHDMDGLFTPEDLQADPELGPLINGERLSPDQARQHNWQPNIVADAAVDHVVAKLRRRAEFSSSIGLNDGLRFDQSDATRRQLGDPNWFRHRPDFSPLYFQFANKVARKLPDRYLGAYAYYWTEQSPPFVVERNVVPFLTADRSQWVDPAFAEEDKALIRRWTASGAEVVGLYDYYYGAPFLVPRPTLDAVAESIAFAHQAGVRAFYAEATPNWSLDGPKLWLAAQLLWDSTQPAEGLLDTYYREFWREAAGPMREFYRLADEPWRHLPPPNYWLKFFKDEDHHRLFPPETRRRLREQVEAALAAAQTELTRNRVRFVAAGLAAVDAYAAWGEARDRLSRAALGTVVDAPALRRLADDYVARKQALLDLMAGLKREHPLALGGDLNEAFLLNDPIRRAEWRLGAKGNRLGPEMLLDPALHWAELGPVSGFFDIDWMRRGFWDGNGEPYQTRQIRWAGPPGSGAEATSAALAPRTVRLEGCKQEILGQALRVTPGKSCLARVKVRGRVSPGNFTYLLLNFRDAAGKLTGANLIDRLPQGEWEEAVELAIWAEVPADAVHVVYGVRVMNQVNDDFAEFTGFSLREVD